MYGSESAADTYHAARGNTTWAAATSANKLIALQRGSDFVDRTFVLRFPGTRTNDHTQTEEWPRTGATYYRTGEAIAATVVPVEVEYSAYEAALRELDNPGILLADYTPSSIPIEAKGGPVDVKFATGQSPLAVVAAVEGLLSSILVPNVRPSVMAV